MTTVPKPIRVLAIALMRRGDEILVSTDFDPIKGDHYSRPLGGGVEFGEYAELAIAREIREELGAEIENIRLFTVIENLFTLEGCPSHEIVFVYDAEFADKSLYERDELAGYEIGLAADFTARWMTPGKIAADKVRLVPEALPGLLNSIPLSASAKSPQRRTS